MNDTIKDLNYKLTDLEHERNILSQRINSDENLESLLEEERQKQSNLLTEARKELEKHKATIQSLNNEITKITMTLDEKKLKLDDKDREIAKKNDQIKILEQENEDKIKQLDKFKSGMSMEMQEMEKRNTTLEAEKRKLLLQISDLERSKAEANAQIETQKGEQFDVENSLRSKITDLEQELKIHRRTFDEELKQEAKKQANMQRTIDEQKSVIDNFTRDVKRLEENIMRMKKTQHDFSSFKEMIMTTINKLLKNYGDIESNLSCLSCLEFLEDPLMLI